MDRRAFVKGCVAAAGAAAVGGTLLAAAGGSMVPRESGARVVRYFAARRVRKPAPRGVPLIPMGLNAQGQFVGKPSIQGPAGEIDALDWYKYCQHGGAPGLRPDFNGDNVARYFAAEDKLKNAEVSAKLWFKDRLGEPVTPEAFGGADALRASEGGAPGASFVWRSQGQSGTSILTGVIVRLPADEIRFPSESLDEGAGPLDAQEAEAVLSQCVVRRDGHAFVGVSTFCTHFCCAPGWKEAEAYARSEDTWDDLFCTCHGSAFDPRQIVAYQYVPQVAQELSWPNTV